MDARELAWRSCAEARIASDRVKAVFRSPRWRPSDLQRALAPLPELTRARAALAMGRWDEAHDELARHFGAAAQRFVIAMSSRERISARVLSAFPDAAHSAARRADAILDGRYDLLGYNGLQFADAAACESSAPSERSERLEPSVSGVPDWHLDPVHRRRAPRRFWAAVPYLDPACGDHKIVWELNRHQHWLILGRALWLTGEVKYRERFVAELRSWLDDNPPLVGINWASMLELGLRSISWIWALHLFAEPDGARRGQAPWIVDLLLGIDRQLAHVERNLSYYFSPNTHLLGEALALYVGGRALPELRASARREALGRSLLVVEMDRQIGPDGGHCERSTHYHRYTLDFYLLALTVARITGDPAAGRFEHAVGKLAAAARLLADDRGRLPRIGDDDGGALWPMFDRPADDVADSLAIAAALADRPDLTVGAPPEEAIWLLDAPPLAPALERLNSAPPPSTASSDALPDTGYYVSRSSGGTHVVIDGGPHGYRNAGHAHADALSLTMTFAGMPMIIDPGTGCYTVNSELRDRMRSTALHNTLVLDGQSQSMPDGPFRWRHAADSRTSCWRTASRFDYFVGAHDGYAPVLHRRHVLIVHGDLLVVADLVDGPGAHLAAQHWHIHPAWTVRATGRHVELTHGGTRCDFAAASGPLDVFTGDEDSGLGWHSPAYGRLEPATTLRVTTEGDAPFWMAAVFGLDDRNRLERVAFLPAPEPTSAHAAPAAALRLFRRASVDDVVIGEHHLLCDRTSGDGRSRTIIARLRADHLCAA
jgi:hypothetical protein